MATVLYVAASKRYCSEHAMFMMHPTEMPQPGQMRAETLQSLLDLDAALTDDQRIENILSQRTSIPKDTLTSRRYREVHITPQEAVKFGLCCGVCEFALPRENELFQI